MPPIHDTYQGHLRFSAHSRRFKKYCNSLTKHPGWLDCWWLDAGTLQKARPERIGLVPQPKRPRTLLKCIFKAALDRPVFVTKPFGFVWWSMGGAQRRSHFSGEMPSKSISKGKKANGDRRLHMATYPEHLNRGSSSIYPDFVVRQFIDVQVSKIDIVFTIANTFSRNDYRKSICLPNLSLSSTCSYMFILFLLHGL